MKTNNSKLKWYHSLKFTLFKWFISLAILPLIVFSWLSYNQTEKGLKHSVAKEMRNSAPLYLNFVQNWFKYREIDVQSWADKSNTIHFMGALTDKGFAQNLSNKDTFINSVKYQELLGIYQDDYKKLSNEYRYIYDIYFLDTKGNLLFSIAQNKDLGTNFFHGPYSNTKFATIYRRSLGDGKIHFSDFERYEPSDNGICSFLSTPIVDEEGNIIGVFAIQTKLDDIYNQFQQIAKQQSSLNNYLVGSDMLLRSAININNINININDDADILKRRIFTPIVQMFSENKLDSNKLYEYTGPNGNPVLGMASSIEVLDSTWILISETNRSIIDKPLAELLKNSLKITLFFLLFIAIFSLYIAQSLIKPLQVFIRTISNIIQGDRKVQVNINDKSEIGLLAGSFNSMVETLNQQESAIQIKTQEAEDALYELQEQKLALDEHSIVGITDVKGNITYVNDKFVDISGYSREELMGHNHRLLNTTQHDKVFWKRMYATVSNGEVWNNPSICNRKKDGSLYWVDTTIVPFMKDGKPQSYIAIRTDITESKEIEDELILSNEKAESAVRAKAEFLASMSHEIRTPMNGVIGMLGLLLNTDLNQQQNEKALIAQSSAKSLLSIINDILDFSKLEAGKVELDPTPFSSTHELTNFIKAIKVNIQDKDVQLLLKTNILQERMIVADIGRLKQILNNLVGNAIKFTHEGEISIEVAINTTTTTPSLFIAVSDSGIGIPQDKLKSLFDSFSQVDASTTRKYGGTGLGLTIAKNLVEIMGGTLAVDSIEGSGTTFSFNINIELSDEKFNIANTTVEAVDKPHLNVNSKILVVDDNITNQLVAQGILETLGLTCDLADNGQIALDMLNTSAETYDIIFMDCQMPILDGYQTTQAIRNGEGNFINKEIPIIAMTANAMTGDKERCISQGMDDYISKPIHVDALYKVLSHYLPHENNSKVIKSDVLEAVISNTPSHQLIWDKETAIARVMGKEKIFKKIITSFIDENNTIVSNMKHAIQNYEIENIKILAHTIKGSSSNIGGILLAQIATDIEYLAKENNIMQIEEKFKLLQNTSLELEKELLHYLKG
jgi:PAS domain S-box-containing protein